MATPVSPLAAVISGVSRGDNQHLLSSTLRTGRTSISTTASLSEGQAWSTMFPCAVAIGWRLRPASSIQNQGIIRGRLEFGSPATSTSRSRSAARDLLHSAPVQVSDYKKVKNKLRAAPFVPTLDVQSGFLPLLFAHRMRSAKLSSSSVDQRLSRAKRSKPETHSFFDEANTGRHSFLLRFFSLKWFSLIMH